MPSFQKQHPAGRVNIALDVIRNGQQQRCELPFKLLVLGNFSAQTQTTTVKERECFEINRLNFNAVLEKVAPKLSLTLPNQLKPGSEQPLSVQLHFKTLKDFEPEQLAQQIPELAQLVAMRNLLKELKAHLLNNPLLRKQLKTLLQDKNQRQRLQQELLSLPVDEEGNNA